MRQPERILLLADSRDNPLCLTLPKTPSYNSLLILVNKNATVRESAMVDEQQPEGDITDHLAEPQRALEEITKLGITSHPHKFARTPLITEIVQGYPAKTGEELEAAPVRVAGRVHAINKMGKAAFICFTDGGQWSVASGQ